MKNFIFTLTAVLSISATHACVGTGDPHEDHAERVVQQESDMFDRFDLSKAIIRPTDAHIKEVNDALQTEWLATVDDLQDMKNHYDTAKRILRKIRSVLNGQNEKDPNLISRMTELDIYLNHMNQMDLAIEEDGMNNQKNSFLALILKPMGFKHPEDVLVEDIILTNTHLIKALRASSGLLNKLESCINQAEQLRAAIIDREYPELFVNL